MKYTIRDCLDCWVTFWKKFPPGKPFQFHKTWFHKCEPVLGIAFPIICEDQSRASNIYRPGAWRRRSYCRSNFYLLLVRFTPDLSLK